MGDYNCGTLIKIEEDNKDTKKHFTEALVKESKPSNIEKTYKSCFTTHNDKKTINEDSYKLNETGDVPRIKIEEGETDDYYCKSIIEKEENNEQQKTIDGNSFTEEKIKVEIKEETDDYNSCPMNRIDEENEDTKENIIEALMMKPSLTCFEKSYNSCGTVQNYRYKTFDGISYYVGETCNETIVKEETDLGVGNYFESVIKIKKKSLSDVQTTKNDLEEIQSFVCDMCKKSFETKRRVAWHISHSHSAHSTTQQSSGKQDVENNITVNHTTVGVTDGYTGNIGRPYKCGVCLKSFTAKSSLTVHKRVHTGEKPYKCNVCLISFSIKSCLTVHKLVHTGEKPYKCVVCSKSFSLKPYLTKHERVHTGEKPYKCNVCLKSFSDTSTLTVHKRAHTGEKPYKCVVCSKSFSDKSTLAKHKRLHTDEKPYNCDVCSKSFNQKVHFEQHKRVHTGEKPYKCNVCLMKFSVKSSLSLHKRVHTGEKPYKCLVCSKSFSRKHDLTRHNKRMHAGEMFIKFKSIHRA
ncbi:zinc finger protein 761-like isoform X2 [Adelges cooleyi]|uniref:zinc finger protein 761-like isoform X2 n=1 Tax=Adelges cooleyi TaxID=133065 RepID=UPI00217F7895|nr:zinc finger protein 761-like isoform X2 [Adelges cooleyi]